MRGRRTGLVIFSVWTGRIHLESFLAAAREEHERGLPRYVERELRAYLQCGIHAYGFLRARRSACGAQLLVAFSCKRRGACPSCNTRRMCATAAHLTDHVLPDVPVRQWVLSVPFEPPAARVHDLDALACRCGGRLRVIAVITEPAVAAAILDSVGLPSRPPPLARSRSPDDHDNAA